MTEQLPSGAFLSFILLDPEIRAEMERLMQKGISGETIAQAISERYHCSVEYVPINRDIHPFTKDYGTPPILPDYEIVTPGYSNVVDGMVEEEDQLRFPSFALIKAYMAKYPWHDAVEGSIVKDASEFTCAICHYTYVKGQTDEVAMEETNRHWPGTSIEECGVVCDTCWQRMKPDQQNAVHAAYDFMAGINKLQITAGHSQDEFNVMATNLLNMAKGENEHA